MVKPGDRFHVTVSGGSYGSLCGTVTIVGTSHFSSKDIPKWEVIHNIKDLGNHWDKTIFLDQEPHFHCKKLTYPNTKLGKILYK